MTAYVLIVLLFSGQAQVSERASFASCALSAQRAVATESARSALCVPWGGIRA